MEENSLRSWEFFKREASLLAERKWTIVMPAAIHSSSAKRITSSLTSSLTSGISSFSSFACAQLVGFQVSGFKFQVPETAARPITCWVSGFRFQVSSA